MVGGSWTVAKSSLEELDYFLCDVIPGIGATYRALLSAYDNPVGAVGYRDRGYAEAKQLFELLSAPPKQYRDNTNSGDDEEESGHFPRLVKLTTALVPHMPAADKHLTILNRLRETYLEPMRELVYKTVPERMGEREGRLVLSPDEFVNFAEGASAIMEIYHYLKGRSYLDVGYLVDGKAVEDLVKRFIPSLDAFGAKWNQHWDLYPDRRGIDEFGVITLAITDSLDGSTIVKSLELGKPSTYVPEKGINNVIFENRDTLRNGMRNDLLTGTQRDTMCTASMIRRRGDVGEFLKYLKGVKKASRFRENNNQWVV